MAKVYHAELWGLREGKYKSLSETDVQATQWQELKPSSPFYLFVPLNEDLLSEYEKGWKVTDIFPVNSVGIVTARDHFVLDFDEAILKQRITQFRATALSDDEIKEHFKLADNEGWSVASARKAIQQDKDWDKAFTKCLYRPFDVRPIFYHKAVIERSRPEVMRQIIVGENFALVSARSNKSPEMNHFFCSRLVMETKCGESTTQSCLFPLYLCPIEEKEQLDKSGGKEGGTQPAMTTQNKREPNLRCLDIERARLLIINGALLFCTAVCVLA